MGPEPTSASARLFRRTDKDGKARAHFTAATVMYRDMRMTYWLAAAEREL